MPAPNGNECRTTPLLIFHHLRHYLSRADTTAIPAIPVPEVQPHTAQSLLCPQSHTRPSPTINRHLPRHIYRHLRLRHCRYLGVSSNNVRHHQQHQQSSTRCTCGHRRPTSGSPIPRVGRLLRRVCIRPWQRRTRTQPHAMSTIRTTPMTGMYRRPLRRRRSISRKSRGGAAHTHTLGHTQYRLVDPRSALPLLAPSMPCPPLPSSTRSPCPSCPSCCLSSV